MKNYSLRTIYPDFNYSVQFFYKQEKNSVNGCPRYRVWVIDPEINRVHETILSGYEPIETLLENSLDEDLEPFRLERVRQAINAFSFYEYGSEPYLTIGELPELIPLAYTTAGDDEEHEMQVSFNRVTCELIEEFDGVIKQRTKYTLEEFAEMMENVDFNDLIRDLWQYVPDEEGDK